mgnify:CR=1 FL=1
MACFVGLLCAGSHDSICDFAMPRHSQVTHSGIEAIVFQVLLSLANLAEKALGAQNRAITMTAASVGLPVETIRAEVLAGEPLGQFMSWGGGQTLSLVILFKCRLAPYIVSADIVVALQVKFPRSWTPSAPPTLPRLPPAVPRCSC